MTILLFIILLAVLIFVHELGHFLAAKSAGVRVDEFGIGFPPRAVSWRPAGGETLYSLNWIPFGGFVKIVGENGEDVEAGDDPARSFVTKGALVKVWILAAGVIFNILFGWLAISAGFMSGLPVSVTPQTQGLQGPAAITIIDVVPESAALNAGLLPGDAIIALADEEGNALGEGFSVHDVQAFIAEHGDEPILLTYVREATESATVSIVPLADATGKGMIGVALDLVGTVKLGVGRALLEGGKTTLFMLRAIFVGIGTLIADSFRGDADLSNVAGPVGIAGLVGDVAERGFIALLSFAAVISLNLAVLNLIPFPALDGGRILFVIIEKLKGSPIPAKVATVANLIGFGLLILLMLVVTVNDVANLF